MINLIDTNILYSAIRSEASLKYLKENYNIFNIDSKVDFLISIVSIAEIQSIAKINNWGSKKINVLLDFLDLLLTIDINYEDVISKYAEIDAFSQGKLKGNPLYSSSKNMGKNDLWIAATASALNAKLITSDKDFIHLNNKYLDLDLVKF